MIIVEDTSWSPVTSATSEDQDNFGNAMILRTLRSTVVAQCASQALNSKLSLILEKIELSPDVTAARVSVKNELLQKDDKGLSSLLQKHDKGLSSLLPPTSVNLSAKLFRRKIPRIANKNPSTNAQKYYLG